ncbi:hypothetical protein ROZALSC1DRAFT_30035, partial [Rozella allomycis CSF55]
NHFQHILRVLNTNIDGKNNVMYALTSIKGIGRRFANLACKKAEVNLKKRAGELTSEELERLVTVVQNPQDYKIPEWFLNRQKDIKDGSYSQKIRVHRGLRHFWGLRVRGQHTKTTGRRGRTVGGTIEEQEQKYQTSTTIYVGNLSFYTTEEQIFELFSIVGPIKRIIIGLDKYKKTPCGFCFVEYYKREDAMDCMKYINGTKLDDRYVRTDVDPGFLEGRQYGRGRSGGQVRDEYRTDFDQGRGGYGAREYYNDQNSSKRRRMDESRFRNDESD